MHLVGFIICISVSLTHNLSKDYSTGLANPLKNNFPCLLRLPCGPSPPQWAIITTFAFVMRCVLASDARESCRGGSPSNANVWWDAYDVGVSLSSFASAHREAPFSSSGLNRLAGFSKITGSNNGTYAFVASSPKIGLPHIMKCTHERPFALINFIRLRETHTICFRRKGHHYGRR